MSADSRHFRRGKGAFGRRTLLQAAGAFAATPALSQASRLPMAGVDAAAAKAAKRIGTGGEPLVVLLPNGSQGNVLPVLRAFTQQSGIEVEHRVAPLEDINTMMLLQASKRKSSFDVALPATYGMSELAEAQAILKLTPLVKKYLPAQFDADAYFTLGDTFRGERYGFQTDGDVYMLFALDRLQSEAEKEAYQAKTGRPLRWPTTWEELDRQLAFFHRPKAGEYGGLLFRTPAYAVWEWWLRIHSKGRFPVDADFVPQVASEEGVAALEELLAATEHLHPAAATAGLFDNWDVYKEQKCIYNLGWGGSQKAKYRKGSPLRGHLLHGATPGITGASGAAQAMASFNWGWSYTVSKLSRHPEVAFLLTVFATSPTQSLVAVAEPDGFFDPFRKGHYVDASVIDAYGESFLKAHAAARAVTIPDFYVSAQEQFFGSLRDGIGSALAGERSAKAAMEHVSSAWHRIIRRAGRKNLSRQWRYVRASYPAAHRKLLR